MAAVTPMEPVSPMEPESMESVVTVEGKVPVMVMPEVGVGIIVAWVIPIEVPVIAPVVSMATVMHRIHS